MMTTNLRRRIVAVALQEFFRHGIKAVKMDDIARILSISKRTLYQVFEEKQQLLLECLKSRREQNLQYMQHFEQKGCNVIENSPDAWREPLVLLGLAALSCGSQLLPGKSGR